MRPRYGDASGSEGHDVAALVVGELEAVLIGRREAVAGLLAALGAVQHRFDLISLVSAGGRAEGEPHDWSSLSGSLYPSWSWPGGNRMTSPAPTAEESGRSATAKVASPD